MNAKKILKYVASLPKTIYFNFKVFNFKQAIKLPVFVSKDVVIKNIYKNTIDIKSHLTTGMIKIALEEGTTISPYAKKSIWNVNKNSKIVFEGKASFSRGVAIVSGTDSILKFGKNFSSNSCCNFFVDKYIKFGDDCLMGWNVSVHDGDGHKIYDNKGNRINYPDDIIVGDHVWICADVKILKGSSIPNNCIIARNSLLSKKFEIENAIYAGSPAKMLKQNIQWEQ